MERATGGSAQRQSSGEGAVGDSCIHSHIGAANAATPGGAAEGTYQALRALQFVPWLQEAAASRIHEHASSGKDARSAGECGHLLRRVWLQGE